MPPENAGPAAVCPSQPCPCPPSLVPLPASLPCFSTSGRCPPKGNPGLSTPCTRLPARDASLSRGPPLFSLCPTLLSLPHPPRNALLSPVYLSNPCPLLSCGPSKTSLPVVTAPGARAYTGAPGKPETALYAPAQRTFYRIAGACARQGKETS